MNLAPPSGPASIPSLPAPLTQPSIAAVPPVVAPPGASAPGQAVLSLTARYGKDLPVIANGLVWRVFSDRPDETGTFKLIREERGATPNIVLPPGSYVVHVALGLVSAVRAVTLRAETARSPSYFRPADRIEAASAPRRYREPVIHPLTYKGSQWPRLSARRSPPTSLQAMSRWCPKAPTTSFHLRRRR